MKMYKCEPENDNVTTEQIKIAIEKMDWAVIRTSKEALEEKLFCFNDTKIDGIIGSMYASINAHVYDHVITEEEIIELVEVYFSVHIENGAAKEVPVTVAAVWGAHGVRYDEECDRCGRVVAVDNDTGLCKRCGGGR